MQGRKGGAGEEDILVRIEYAVFFIFIFTPFLSIIYFDNLLCLFISGAVGRILFLLFTLAGDLGYGQDGWGGACVGVSIWGCLFISFLLLFFVSLRVHFLLKMEE